MWQVKFYSEKATYGRLVATWSPEEPDEFNYEENLDVADEGATREFTAEAIKLRGNESTARENKYVNVIQANLNK